VTSFQAPRRRIEIPKDSGRVAYYTPAEQEFMRALLEVEGVRGQEVLLFHELKVEFGVDLGDLRDGTPCAPEAGGGTHENAQPTLLEDAA
jgi:hypothetical protein